MKKKFKKRRKRRVIFKKAQLQDSRTGEEKSYQILKEKIEEAFPDKKERLVYIKALIEKFKGEIKCLM